MKGFKIFLLLMLLGFVIAIGWESIPLLKEGVHFILDPTLGALLNIDYMFGMFVVVFVINLAIVLVHRYTIDPEKLKSLKQEQKSLQQEMKRYRDQPEKLLELQKQSIQGISKNFELTMKPLTYTLVPILLSFRWFSDYFAAAGNVKFFGFLSWFWFYFIFSIIFSTVLRKLFKL